MTQAAKQAATLIQQKIGDFKPQIAIVLGSGLGKFAEAITDARVFAYQDLPGFPRSQVKGHGGSLYIGTLAGKRIACMQGRAHFYEGLSNEILLTPIRTLRLLGCHTLIATNSAGSLHKNISPGNLVILRDHINMQFKNPLVGFHDEEFGPRFVGMENAYDANLRELIAHCAGSMKIHIYDGIYLATLGPTFETPAEIAAYRTLGADVVGMSTISEIITARHCGMRCGAISVITNLAAGMNDETLSHDVTLRGAALGSDTLVKLLMRVIEKIDP